MAALETLERLEGVEDLDDAQEQAAATAKTVGDFTKKFHEHAKALVERGAVDEGEVEERGSNIDAAAKGNEDLKLDALETNVLGQAQVGGGRSGILLARSVAAAVRTAADVERMRHTAAHEDAHAKQAQLRGALVVDGEKIDNLLLLEGDAELAGNEATGHGIEAKRPGQPDKVYKEGQDVVIDIVRKVGKAKFREVLRDTGDVSELQGALAA